MQAPEKIRSALAIFEGNIERNHENGSSNLTGFLSQVSTAASNYNTAKISPRRSFRIAHNNKRSNALVPESNSPNAAINNRPIGGDNESVSESASERLSPFAEKQIKGDALIIETPAPLLTTQPLASSSSSSSSRLRESTALQDSLSSRTSTSSRNSRVTRGSKSVAGVSGERNLPKSKSESSSSLNNSSHGSSGKSLVSRKSDQISSSHDIRQKPKTDADASSSLRNSASGKIPATKKIGQSSSVHERRKKENEENESSSSHHHRRSFSPHSSRLKREDEHSVSTHTSMRPLPSTSFHKNSSNSTRSRDLPIQNEKLADEVKKNKYELQRGNGHQKDMVVPASPRQKKKELVLPASPRQRNPRRRSVSPRRTASPSRSSHKKPVVSMETPRSNSERNSRSSTNISKTRRSPCTSDIDSSSSQHSRDPLVVLVDVDEEELPRRRSRVVVKRVFKTSASTASKTSSSNNIKDALKCPPLTKEELSRSIDGNKSTSGPKAVDGSSHSDSSRGSTSSHLRRNSEAKESGGDSKKQDVASLPKENSKRDERSLIAARMAAFQKPKEFDLSRNRSAPELHYDHNADKPNRKKKGVPLASILRKGKLIRNKTRRVRFADRNPGFTSSLHDNDLTGSARLKVVRRCSLSDLDKYRKTDHPPWIHLAVTRIQSHYRGWKTRQLVQIRMLQHKIDCVEARKQAELECIQIIKWRKMEQTRQLLEQRYEKVDADAKLADRLTDVLSRDNEKVRIQNETLHEYCVSIKEMNDVLEESIKTHQQNYSTLKNAIEFIAKDNERLERQMKKLEADMEDTKKEIMDLNRLADQEKQFQDEIEETMDSILNTIQSRCKNVRLVGRVFAIKNQGIMAEDFDDSFGSLSFFSEHGENGGCPYNIASAGETVTSKGYTNSSSNSSNLTELLDSIGKLTKELEY